MQVLASLFDAGTLVSVNNARGHCDLLGPCDESVSENRVAAVTVLSPKKVKFDQLEKYRQPAAYKYI